MPQGRSRAGYPTQKYLGGQVDQQYQLNDLLGARPSSTRVHRTAIRWQPGAPAVSVRKYASAGPTSSRATSGLGRATSLGLCRAQEACPKDASGWGGGGRGSRRWTRRRLSSTAMDTTHFCTLISHGTVAMHCLLAYEGIADSIGTGKERYSMIPVHFHFLFVYHAGLWAPAFFVQ